MSARLLVVRPGFVASLAAVCQRFAGDVLTLEPGAFCGAVRRLTTETPSPASAAETMIVRERIPRMVFHGAHVHHAWFHKWFRSRNCT